MKIRLFTDSEVTLFYLILHQVQYISFSKTGQNVSVRSSDKILEILMRWSKNEILLRNWHYAYT